MSDQELDDPPFKKPRLDNNLASPTVGPAREEEDFTKDILEKDAEDFSVDNSKYTDFVTPEEVERLKEFQVLDEVKSNDEDSEEEESDSSDGKSEGVPEEEIEKMLDEDLPEDFKGAPKTKEKTYITRQKTVLEEKGTNHFEVLPLDWMMVRHYSGMPVYMHRASRVCTLSKPYFLGKGNTRRHEIPISAIPCLNYRKALEEEAKQKEIDLRIAEQIRTGSWQNNTSKGKQAKPSDQNSVGNSNQNNKKSSENAPIEIDIEVNNKPNGLLANAPLAALETNDVLHTSLEGNDAQPSTSISNDVQQITLESNDVQTSSLECSDAQQTILASNDAKPSSLETSEAHTLVNDAQSTTSDINAQNVEQNDEVSSNTPKCPFAPDSTIQVPTGDANGEVVEEEIPLSAQPVVLPGGIVMAPPRVETVNTSWKTQHLTPEQVNDYCKNLFKFKTVHIMHFKRWADRRKYAKARKTLQYPTLPEGTKLITIPAKAQTGNENGGLLGGSGRANKRDWVMNMNGRSYLSVFHEYVRRALDKQPVYEFRQLENASTPYQATVYIGGMQYGVGRGTSKRLAKANAARASIQILIPEMRDTDDAPTAENDHDSIFFDCVGIEDPRISEFCAATCEPSPHATLRTCLLRNFGAGDRHIHTEMKKLEYQKIELTMKVGKHTATVVCKNKKTAKQRASQAILQALHPHVRSWGSLLRLYGSRSVKSCKEKKLEEQQITLLQDKARHNEPNYAVLEKLRVEMQRLRDRDEAVVPIGTLLVKEDLPTHSGSNLNNVEL